MATQFFRRYVFFLVFSPVVSDEKCAEQLQAVKNSITAMGGKIEKDRFLGIKQINMTKKYDKGSYYQMYFFIADNDNLKANIQELNRITNSKNNQYILRSKILFVEHEKFNFHSLANFQGFTESHIQNN